MKIDFDNLLYEHEKYIYSRFDKDTPINFGWVTDDNSICSKIYSAPRQYVSSTVDTAGHITHEIESD